MVAVALYLIIYRVILGLEPGGDIWQIGAVLIIHGVNHRSAGPRACGHKFLVSGIEDQRVALRFRGGGDFGLLPLNLKRLCNRGVFKGVVAVALRRDSHGGGAHVDIVAVRYNILTGRDHCGAVSFLQRDNRLLGGAVVDIGVSAVGLHCQALAAQLNCGIHRLFGNRRCHALRSLAGVIGRLLDAVPDGIFARVGALREAGGVGAVLAQGVFHNYASRVYHRPGGNQLLLSAVVGRCRGNRRGCDLGDRLADGRLDGEAGVGNVVVFRIFAGDVSRACIHPHRFIRTGIFIVKGAGQAGNDNLILGQDALFYICVDRGVRIAVIVLILRRHDGGDGLLLRGEGQEGDRVLIVGQAGDRVRAGFGGLDSEFTMANDLNLPAVLAYRCHGLAVNRYDLPSDKAIAGTAGRTQSKLIPIGKSVGLVGDGKCRLLPEGDFEGNLMPYNVIVSARFIGNDYLCRLTRSTHVPVVFIGHVVLACRQDGIAVLDCDRRLFPVAVILVLCLGQLHYGRDLFAQDFHVGDLGGIWVDSKVVVRYLYCVPDMVLPRVGADGDGGGVGTVFVCRKFDLQAVIHRHRDQRARSHQVLGGAVVSRRGGGGGRVNGADFADCQRDGLAGGRLVVRPLRECNHNVISTGVSGQAVCVGAAAPLCPVGILEPVVQVLRGRYIDLYVWKVDFLRRTAVIVQFYRDRLGSGIPFQYRPFQIVFGERVVLRKGSVVGDALNGDSNSKADIANSGLCFIGYGVIGALVQLRRGIFHFDRDSTVRGLDGVVIGQGFQALPIHGNGNFVFAEAACSCHALREVECTGL